jgi:hypothetical protein
MAHLFNDLAALCSWYPSTILFIKLSDTVSAFIAMVKPPSIHPEFGAGSITAHTFASALLQWLTSFFYLGLIVH